MRAVLLACKAAGVREPMEVQNYFAYMNTEEINGNEADDIAKFSLTNTPCCDFYFGDDKSRGPGLTIHLGKLMKGVTDIHFFVR